MPATDPQFSAILTRLFPMDRGGPIVGTEIGQCGPFRALRCRFLDERERTEARSVYACAQMIRVVASAQTDRQFGSERSLADRPRIWERGSAVVRSHAIPVRT